MERFVSKPEILRFVVECMTKVGASHDHAEQLGLVLLAADYRGHYSHGLNRLDMYVKDVRSGGTNSSGSPKIVKEAAATAVVDGCNLLGPVVGKFCIDVAVAKAKDAGIGWVVARNSNHFGIAGWYSMRAADMGMLGMAFTNASPILVPSRAKKPALGTNPISLAAPSSNPQDPFVLDMATSAVAFGKVEMQHRKEEALPPGWAVDSEGNETLDAAEGVQGGVMPLGGREESSGYKGYGLAMLVEVFCAMLSGSHYGPFVRNWKTTDVAADLGQCFVAINPEMFADGFTDRMSEMMNVFRNLDPVDGSKPVLVPGDPERDHIRLCDDAGGIPYHPNQISHLETVAAELGVKKMDLVK